MISVCIATYNGERYIRQQIESIVCQLNVDDEIIVSDDGSTDNTVAILNNIGDKRIRIIEGPRKHSPTLNFEYALKVSKGDYIFLSDQDDVWKSNKVEVCIKWLQQYDCIVSDAEVTDCSLNPLHPSLYSIMQVRPERIYNTIWKTVSCPFILHQHIYKLLSQFFPLRTMKYSLRCIAISVFQIAHCPYLVIYL